MIAIGPAGRTTRRRSVTGSGHGSGPGRAPAAARRGMTLIELMIAILVLNVALLALAGLAATVSKQVRYGAAQTRAAMLVQSRLDSLASVLPCTDVASNGETKTGTYTQDGITEKWVIADGDNVILVIDSVSVPGRSKPIVYQSMIPCRN